MTRHGCFALVAALVALLVPGVARADGLVGSVTLVSEPGESLLHGTSELLDTRGTPITTNGSRHYLTIVTDDALILLGGPGGADLAVGQYPVTTRMGSADTALLDVNVGSSGCNDSDGRLTINDIHFDADDHIDRLWAQFEQHCEHQTPALFGEIHIAPDRYAALTTEPSAVRWPGTVPGVQGVAVPVEVVAGPGGSDVTGVALSGADAADFSISGDTCTGATLTAGSACGLKVTFTPSAAGPRVAQLDVTQSDGGSVHVPLVGPTLIPTTTSALVSPATSIYGTPLHLSATVAPVSSTGRVKFAVPGFADDLDPLTSGGTADGGIWDDIDVGSSVTATYLGDRANGSSTVTQPAGVSPAPTVTSLKVATGALGSVRSVTATVANTATGATPFGVAQLFVDGAAVGVPQPLSDRGVALFKTPIAALGDHTIVVRYHDDTGDVADFIPSEGSTTLTIGAAPVHHPVVSTPVVPQSVTDTIALGKPRVGRDGRLLLAVTVPRAGMVVATATSASTALKGAFGSATAGTAAAGTMHLVIRPNAKARRALAKHRAIRVTIAVSFAPPGSLPTANATAKATTRLPQRHRRRHRAG